MSSTALSRLMTMVFLACGYFPSQSNLDMNEDFVSLCTCAHCGDDYIWYDNTFDSAE